MPALGIPELGVTGCGIATAIAMWAQVVLGLWVLKRDRFYAPFALRSQGRGLRPPDRQAIGAQLRLGMPMGASIMIEVTGFTFMAIFIVRLGATPVAGHQLAANLVSVLFMMPLALANATATLVAQRVGARDLCAARRIGWHGLQISIGLRRGDGRQVYRCATAWCACTPTTRRSSPRRCRCWPGWRCSTPPTRRRRWPRFVLRAYRIATLPMFIFAISLWGVGLGGGYVLAFDLTGLTPRGRCLGRAASGWHRPSA